MITISRIRVFLQLFAIAHILGGIALPFLVNTSLFASYNELLYRALGFESNVRNPNVNFLIVLFGPTIASWGVLFLYVVTSGFRNPNKHAWWTILFSCIVWAPYDSLLSIQQGIYINALINLVSASAILIPLFLARKHFFSS